MEAIYEGTRELLTAIRNTLTYFVNSKPGAALGRVVLSGGGSHLGGVGQALSEAIGVNVVQADPFAGAQLSRGVRSRATQEQQDSMVTAFGLALGSVA